MNEAKRSSKGKTSKSDVTRTVAWGGSEGVEAQIMLDSLKDIAVILLDSTGVVRTWPRSAREMIGYEADEVIGQPLSFFCSEEECASQLPEQALKEADTLGRWEKQGLRTRKDGSTFWANVLVYPAVERDGKRVGYVHVTRDYTEMRGLANAASKVAAYTRSLIEASPDPLLTISPQGKIMDVNLATIRATGYAREEIIGTEFSKHFTQPELARAGYEAVFRESIVRDYPLEMKHREGRVTPVLYNASVYKDDDGTVMGVFAAARDITEMRRAEERIRQQSTEILDLSTPVMQVWKGVVVAPLIGSLDSTRTQMFMERLLNRIVETNSPVALVDIMGVPTVDTQTAQHLIETITAVRLLGSQVVLTGVRPAIAQTLVHLAVNLSDITTRSSLAAGLEVALNILELQVVKRDRASRREASL